MARPSARSACLRALMPGAALALAGGAMLALAPSAARAQEGPTPEQIQYECKQLLYYDECVRAGGYANWSRQQSGQSTGSSGWAPERQLYNGGQPYDGGRRSGSRSRGSSGWSAERQLYSNQPGTATNPGSPGWSADRQVYSNQPGTATNPGSSGWSADRQVYSNQPGTATNRGSPGWSADRQVYSNQPGTATNPGSPGWSADRQVYSNQPGTATNPGSPGWSADRQVYSNQPGTSTNRGSGGWSPERQTYDSNRYAAAPRSSPTDQSQYYQDPFYVAPTTGKLCPGLMGKRRTDCLMAERRMREAELTRIQENRQQVERAILGACVARFGERLVIGIVTEGRGSTVFNASTQVADAALGTGGMCRLAH